MDQFFKVIKKGNMADISKYVRSKSQKLLSTLDAVLNLPVNLDRHEAAGDRGRRSFLRSKTVVRPEEAAFEAEFTGAAEDIGAYVDVTGLTSVLCCVGCGLGCGLPLTSCRKGHLYCPVCRTALARTCKLCKQAVTSEAASHQENRALERLLSLIALPCQYK